MANPLSSLISLLCAGMLAAGSASAQDGPDPGRVLATVDGTEITLGHVIALRADLPPQYDQFPDELLFQGIIDQLIQHTLLMNSLDGEASLKSEIEIENETRAILAGQVMNRIVNQDPAEDVLQDLYDSVYPADISETEYSAAHILVETEEEAEALIEELNDGADFASLAREKSIGPSGAAGGDLGWFGKGDMVDVFFNAVAELEPEEVSEPVQTTFGWHVIRLAETRQKERPSFDTVRAELSERARQSALEDHIKALQSEAEITRESTEGLDPSVIQNIDLLRK
ncbi:peptidylprolyl isomerase [Roseovarius aestuariivivens]|uniref:peptidylprolyl isomerase n=1 Tax=Roseovarius aestuariivivens TaxID=1888910 RepID=UPI001080F051|nr:peptidylprolyl isomerase [Roseovarius aestuariivivens]